VQDEEDDGMRTKRGVAARMLGFLLLALGLGLGLPEVALAQKTLKIGGVFELSGQVAGMAYPQSEGLKMAVAEINEKGGVKIGADQYKLELLLFDTRGSPSDAVGIAEKLITKEGVKVLLTGADSATNMAMQEITQPAKILQLCVGCTAFIKVLGAPGKETLFKASPFEGGDKGTAAHFLPWVVKTHKIKTAVLMLPATEAGKVYAEVDERYLKNAGVEVLETIYFTPGLRDFYPQLSRVKLKNPDMLGVGFTDDGVIPILRQAKEMGIKSRLVGLGAGMSEKAAYAAGPDNPIEGYVWIAYFPPLTDPTVVEFCKRYTKTFNKQCKGDVGFSILMYETLRNVLWAMQKVGDPNDTIAIAKALKGHRFDDGVVVREYGNDGLVSSNYWVAEIKDHAINWQYVPLNK
jgi:branched-chain amino acid transport system substrate-binding protein